MRVIGETNLFLKSTSQVNEVANKVTDIIAYTSERKPDEWDNLLDRKSYWKTLRITSWILQFINNCKTKAKKREGTVSPLQTEELLDSKSTKRQSRKFRETRI